MIDYSQFTQALEICVKHNIKLSHISSLVSKGIRKVELVITPSGLINFRFWGHHLSTANFNSKDSFLNESKSLASQEPLGYALLNSCINAEESSFKYGIPKAYKVVVEVSGDSSYRCTIKVPRTIGKGEVVRGLKK